MIINTTVIIFSTKKTDETEIMSLLATKTVAVKCFMFLIILLAAHSPDNSFLGFAVPKKHRSKTREPKNRTNALIYGKLPHFWKVRVHC